MPTNRKSKLLVIACTTVTLVWGWTYFHKAQTVSVGAKDKVDEPAEDLPKVNTISATSAYATNARSRIVMYNRAPKCGSRSFLSVIAKLAVRNNFTDYTSQDFSNMKPKPESMPNEIKQIAELKPPIIFNRHLFYTDFRKYGYEQPIYINLIRDPIDRFSSHYNYMKYGDNMGERDNPMTQWPDINVCVMQNQHICKYSLSFYEGNFFCGMDRTCQFAKKRLELAKKNFDEEYLLVGIMEEFENSLRLFEKMLPEYFAGALQIWKENSAAKNSTASKTRDILNDKSRTRLRTRNLVEEYELYYYAKAKFDRLKMKYGIE